MTRYVPDELPTANTRFVAYAAHAEMVPGPDGSPIKVRAQTYLRYFPAIGINSVARGGRHGDANTVAVDLDVESVNLREKMMGYLGKDDPLGEYIDTKLAQNPAHLFAVALETGRKKKTKNEKSTISPLTPIHALRGASGPDGAPGDNMQAMSGNNISNRIAMIDGQPSAEIVSDPTEWSELVNNIAGNMPPQGWSYYAPGDDWSTIGTITPDDSAPAKGGSGLSSTDLDGLAAILKGVVADALTEHAASQTPRGRVQKKNKFCEGLPYDLRTNDGRINLGHYSVANAGYTTRWAHGYLRDHEHGDPGPANPDTMWALTAHVLSIADAVQAGAYGHGAQPDRAATSHKEATMWVEWVIENEAPLPTSHNLTQTDEETLAVLAEWSNDVASKATTLFGQVGVFVGQDIEAKNKQPEPQQQTEPAHNGDKATRNGDEPHPDSVQPGLNVLPPNWDNQDVIGNIIQRVSERGWDDLTVSISNDAPPVITYPAVQGQASGPLKELLVNRWTALSAPTTTTDTATQEPSAAAAPAPQTAPAEQQSTEASPNPADAPDGEYPDTLVDIIARINNVTTRSALRVVFTEAQSADLLTERVWATLNDGGEVEFGEHGSTTEPEQTLSTVLSHKAQGLPNEDSAESAPQATAVQNPEPTKNTSTPTTNPQPVDASQKEATAQKVVDDFTADKTLDTHATALKAMEDNNLQEVTIQVGNQSGLLGKYLAYEKTRVERARSA